MTDFESRMNTIFTAMSWTNATSKPAIHLGKIKNRQSNTSEGLRATNDVMIPEVDFLGNPITQKFQGVLKGWSSTEARRDAIELDLITELPGQGCLIVDNPQVPRKKNKYKFEMTIEVMV